MLTEDQLKELEDLAAVWFTIEEIATILQVDKLDLSTHIFRTPASEASKAFNRGRLRSEAETRAAVFKAAADGSSPAQTLALKIIADTKLKEL